MKTSLLLVDDEPTCLGAMSEYFATRGFQVTAAREMEEAQALVNKHEYALAITDLSLTSLNSDEGLRLLDHIRHRSPRTKIILLSGRISPEVQAEAAKRGIDAVLSKPQSLDHIAKLVVNILEASNGCSAHLA